MVSMVKKKNTTIGEKHCKIVGLQLHLGLYAHLFNGQADTIDLESFHTHDPKEFEINVCWQMFCFWPIF